MDLYIDPRDVAESKAAFQKLFDQKQAIEAELGEPLAWEKLESRRACRVAIYREGSIDDAPEVLASRRAWMMEKLIKLEKVFGPRLG